VPDFARFLRIAELLQVAQDRELGAVLAEERFTEVSGRLPAVVMTASAPVDAARNGLQYQTRDEGKTWVLVRPERRLIFQVYPGAETSPEVLEVVSLLLHTLSPV
jgi:hypothetical protein